MSTKIKVTGEVFRVYPEGRETLPADSTGPARPAPFAEYDEIKPAVRHAFRIAGEMGCDVRVDRVTKHERITAEMVPDDICGWYVGREETVTATYHVPLPHFSQPPLSRYHAVNGWIIPDTLDIDSDIRKRAPE